MAITRTPIVDDNGTGTTGTILNNAWKQELYNQIDAAPMTGILAKANGVNSVTGGGFLGSLTMPAMALNDTLKIIVSLTQSTGAGGPLNVAIPGTLLVRIDDIGAGRSLAAFERGFWEITIHETPVDGTAIHMHALGGISGQTGGIRTFVGAISPQNWNTGGYPLGIYSTSQGAGGSQSWSWTVWKL